MHPIAEGRPHMESPDQIALLESAARYRVVVDTIGEAILMVDESSVVLFANPAVERIFGYAPADLIGRSLDIVIPARLRGAHGAGIQRYLRTGERRLSWDGAELPGLHKSGREVPLEISFAEHCYDGQRIFTGIVRDVSERRRAQEAIRQSEERFRALAENIEDVFYLAEGEVQRVLYVSPAYEKLWGRPVQGLYADPLDWTLGIHPEDRVRALVSLEKRPEGQNAVEYRIVRPDGSVRWIRDRVFPLPSAPGEPPRYTGIAQDITLERRDHERYRFLADANALFLASALEMRTRLSLLAELCVPILADFCMVDIVQDGRIQRVAAAHADPARAPLVDALLHFPPLPGTPRGPAEAIRTGETILVEDVTVEVVEQAAREPEHRRLIEALAPRTFLTVPLKARDQTLGAISFALSSSGRRFGEVDRALAEELAAHAALAIDNARLYEAMQRAAGARQAILSMVSHELRAPLHAVTLISETLRQSLSNSGRGAEYQRLETIGHLTEQMTRMVDDLVDVTQLESGQFRIYCRPEEIRSILAEAGHGAEPIAREAGIAVSIHCADSLPWVSADRQRTLQVITNLVTNAIGVTPRGGAIELTAEAEGDEVRVSVSDGGPGITPEEVPHLFDHFWRGSRARTTGMGLGLPIAKGIVESQGGRIWAERRPNQERGAVFHFTLPAVPDREEFPPATQPPSESLFLGSDVSPRRVSPERSAREGVAERLARFTSELGRSSHGEAAVTTSLSETLRFQILAGLHTGTLSVGDRLPSIRQVARLMRMPVRAAVNAYAQLEREGVLESYARSGVYVADLERSCEGPPGETARWMVDVLAEAANHQIRLPYLPELFRRWTSAIPLRCACIDSDFDSIATLQGELEHRFGLDAVGVGSACLPALPVRGTVDPGLLPKTLSESHILVTTPLHAPVVRQWADVLDKPLLIAAMHPDISEAIRRRLGHRDLTAVCIDPAYGERLSRLFDGVGPGRIRTVCLADNPNLAMLAGQDRFLLTWAARERLGHIELPLLVPVSPAFAPEFTIHLSRVLIRLNLRLGRK